MAVLSKTDYVLWRECPKNAWLRKHRPDIYGACELTEFEKSIIESGIEVEQVARGLFPEGVLVEGRDEAGQERTRQLLAAKSRTIFQAIFERDDLFAVVDAIQYNEDTDGYTIYEIKSSTKPKDDHLYDLAFQVLLLRRCGLKIDRACITHLNPKYVRSGDLDLTALFVHEDMTAKVDEVATTVTREIETAQNYLSADDEPVGPCSCIYRGRSNHCTTFAHSNPQVPAYGVHDIARIGDSPKKLKEMVDAGIFTLDKIPTHINLSEIQKDQIRAYNSGATTVRRAEIAAELGMLKFPLHFIDYETYPSAIPLFDGFSPYHHIPFQYSLHIVNAPDEEPVHHEFLSLGMEDPSLPLTAALREQIGQTGAIVVWNKRFESGINKAIATRNPDAEGFMNDLNARIYDLMDIFTKHYYVHKDLWGKASIKYVLPVLVPELNYQALDIQEGGSASIAWMKVASGRLGEAESDRLQRALREYCRMDSYAMYAIWRSLREMTT